MWSDNETERDFLNFGTVAATVSQIIDQANGQPVSIGVSGSWGVGKSSMIKLIQNKLNSEPDSELEKKYLFVEFNAWLYQGYDDARAALMEVIARTLAEEAEKQETAIDKTKDLLSRINWLRAAKLSIGSAVSLAAGLPPTGLIGGVYSAGRDFLVGEPTSDEVEAVQQAGKSVVDEGAQLLKPIKASSPPQEIEAIRQGFESALQELGCTLVVLIDDLDRCLPETAISTLEALRLFLFLENTAFVIAADTKMIRHAVRKHFDGIDDILVTNYFDKLIQIPIQVPKLGTQDIRAYLSLLYIDSSSLAKDDKESLRVNICKQLSETWKGTRLDRSYIRKLETELNISIPTVLSAQLDMADRLAPLMSSDTAIEANPRLIKRFLNAISIRMAIGSAQGVALDEAVLTKILLLERCGTKEAYTKIAESSAENENGHPTILKDIEAALDSGNEIELPEEFNSIFFRHWVTSKPTLSDVDLRAVLFVSREHSPLLLSHEQMSTAGTELFEALIDQPDMSAELEDKIKGLSIEDLNLIMDKLLERALREQSWGIPPILEACITVARANIALGNRLGAFLSSRPINQIEPSIVPKIQGEEWSEIAFKVWEKENVVPPVIAAINQGRK